MSNPRGRMAAAFAMFVVVTSGCYEEVSSECDQYVQCLDKLTEETGLGDPNLIATFRFDGACWNSPTTADECTEICQYDINCIRREFTDRNLEIPAECPVGPENEDGTPVIAHCAP